MIKATVNGEEVELSPSDLQLPEGYGLITPDKVPDGYYNKEAVTKLVEEKTAKAYRKKQEELENDSDFHKSVLSKYNVSLGEDGKPKGLKPDFDVDQWKKEQAEKLTQPFKEKLDKTESQLNKFKSGLVRAEILKNANGLFREEYVQSFTGSEDPFVVKQFADSFGVDDEGNVAMKDKDGTFAVDGNGQRITPDKFFESNKDKFANLLKDNRQRGSGLNAGGGGNVVYTEEQIEKMSDEEFEKNRDAINKALAEDNIK